MTFKKALLIILDGFGLAIPDLGNPVTSAHMQFLNGLIGHYPSFSLKASGLAVGMPWGKYGNSEVGHAALGTGRIIIQDLARINNEIKNGEFYKNPAFLKAFSHAEKHDSAVHLIGCVSKGGIHSHEDHLIALLELAARQKSRKTFVHFICDGEDAGYQDALENYRRILPLMKKTGAAVASIGGRVYYMDRVMNWELTCAGWEAMVSGKGETAGDAEEYLKSNYAKKIFDDEIKPAAVVSDGKPVGLIQDNDSLIFFNYRNDRMKQLASSFLEKFDGFKRDKIPAGLFVAAMTRYADEFPFEVAYEAVQLKNTLGEIISDKGFKQLRIAEKEKESHVTNFFNGGRISAFPREERVIVSSRLLVGKEYLDYPQMSSQKIVDAVLEHLPNDFRFFAVNFANSDMIAHTGNIKATVSALKTIDQSLEKIVSAAIKDKIAVVITADHGNAEELIDPLTGKADTQHSNNPVLAVFVAPGLEGQGLKGGLDELINEKPRGTLIDIAPTILYLLGIEKPREMTGSSLVQL